MFANFGGRDVRSIRASPVHFPQFKCLCGVNEMAPCGIAEFHWIFVFGCGRVRYGEQFFCFEQGMQRRGPMNVVEWGDGLVQIDLSRRGKGNADAIRFDDRHPEQVQQQVITRRLEAVMIH